MVWSVAWLPWHLLGACWKCKFSGPAPAPADSEFVFYKDAQGTHEHIMIKQNSPRAPCRAGSYPPLRPDVLVASSPVLWLHRALAPSSQELTPHMV